MTIEIDQLNWEKVAGLIPAIIQDVATGKVLMLAYMNRQAVEQTLTTKKVTFYSRSKQRLWVKGERSGNELILCHIEADCDSDTLLIQAKPTGPVCHLGTETCFKQHFSSDWQVLATLTQVIAQRDKDRPTDSYTAALLAEGSNRLAQKVGEEGVEVTIAAVAGQRQQLCSESADLLFHLLLLLHYHQLSLTDVVAVLRQRM
ncbi:MAG: bifunctional phosphoribosyl-AMP cyclohydrolase/phosphoribosyl-ATP diphosphatase HisIE [Gammaproteobacteria bacterium]|nr:bifunctional phosphoribosyl-AMP cyclohydrolase/phosphoribosyl-ATP diphosphatase HisIE [Gammaproteobacteria bacterium]MCP4476123.1 bifunctional phosphoribosyl-AMP cyclohydrolase/phosphoribosyl-ATP diphosphatase HisIE [Gammaproteobacteria bacterium]